MDRSPKDANDLNRQQFGANAGNYASSVVHAKGASLARIVELVTPDLSWRALDIATAAGHTAFVFAPHVASVVATDLTPEMIELCAHRASELGHTNVSTQLANAEELPFDDASFELVTCRIAPHHFPNPAAFISEVSRVLTDGGVFAFVDNVVSDDQRVAALYNEWERTRDPSHVLALSLEEWMEMCEDAGLRVTASETLLKKMEFEAWLNNMSVPDELRAPLLHDLLDGDPELREFLRPTGSTISDASFVLREGLIVATAGP